MVSINHDSALTPRSLRDTTYEYVCFGFCSGCGTVIWSGYRRYRRGAAFITDHFVLTSRLQEWVVSSMMLGAAIGALFNGWLSFRLGRKYSLMAGAILFVLGSLGSAFASSVEVLIGARVILGVAVGIASYTAPLYLSEMASENVRGKMISMYQLMVTLGIVLAFYPIRHSATAATGARCWACWRFLRCCSLFWWYSCRIVRVGWRKRSPY